MSWLKAANQEKGLRIFGQGITTMALDSAFVFSLDTWNLFDGSKPWRDITLGTVEERMRKMRDPKMRDACKAQYDARPGGGGLSDKGGGLGLNLNKLLFDKTSNPNLEKYLGMQLLDIATQRGEHAVDCFLDLSIEDNLKNIWRTLPHPTNLTELKKVANNEYVVPGVSDGGAHTKFITAGDFTTEFVAHLVRDNDAMSLEDAHWKLAKYPAQAAGMEDRGSIAVGMPADILVYDLKALKILDAEVAYDFPGGEWRRIKRAEGYRYTIVNGEITFEDNRCTGATPGRLLRHGRAS